MSRLRGLPWMVAAAVAVAPLTGGLVLELGLETEPPVLAAQGEGEPSPTSVGALGRLEPGEGVVDVGAAAHERVSRLTVVEGQQVEKGEILAYLDTWEQLVAERDHRQLLQEQAALQLQRAVELGPLEVEASEARVRRLESELEVAKSDLERIEALVADQVVTEQDHDHQANLFRLAQESLREARLLLEDARRRVDLDRREAEARLRIAQAQRQAASAQLARSEIRAPIPGEVLRIFTWPGETVGQEPILRMGETANMFAVAEVYETDVRFVRPGQRATVSSPALPHPLTGTVSRVRSMVYKNDVLDVDPTADRDTRVVEVRIRLDSSETAGRFVHLQVDITIQVTPDDDGKSAPSP